MSEEQDIRKHIEQGERDVAAGRTWPLDEVDPPVRFVLDEVNNVAPVPRLFTDIGGRGGTLWGFAHSRRPPRAGIIVRPTRDGWWYAALRPCRRPDRALWLCTDRTWTATAMSACAIVARDHSADWQRIQARAEAHAALRAAVKLL